LEERESQANFRQDVAGDELLAVPGYLQTGEMTGGIIDRRPRQTGEGSTVQTDRPGFRVETGTVAVGAFDELLFLHPANLAVGVHFRLQHRLVSGRVEMEPGLRHHPVAAATGAPAVG